MSDREDRFRKRRYFEDREYYDIPLFGEVHLDSSQHDAPYSIGEIIRNIKRKNDRTLTVRAMDDGLTEEGILNGDFLTVALQSKVTDGNVAAVQLGERLYIRKVYFERHRVRLEGYGSHPSTLVVDRKTPDFQVIGKVVTVIREL